MTCFFRVSKLLACSSSQCHSASFSKRDQSGAAVCDMLGIKLARYVPKNLCSSFVSFVSITSKS